jgi:hypothetical protein
MTNAPESPVDRLWREYAMAFHDFDDLSLARWLAQTLGQFHGRAWRLSHPLVGAYRLAAQVGNERQVWGKRLATIPPGYDAAPCCGGPLLPLFTRDVLDSGLICQHCGGTSVPFNEIAEALRGEIAEWAGEYAPVHAVAHWEDRQRKAGNYARSFENAAENAEKLLSFAGKNILPRLAENYSAIFWEDHDECLEVAPEDIQVADLPPAPSIEE